jgi:hypothetical protein
MSDTTFDRWLAGLADRKIEETRIPDELGTRVLLWADLSPHLPPDATGAWLLYREGGQVRAAAIGSGKVVGRGQDADLRVDCRWLSRRHFVIRATAEGFELEDLGGKNQLLVNGQPVLSKRLVGGDTIRVGDMDFLFVVLPVSAP